MNRYTVRPHFNIEKDDEGRLAIFARFPGGHEPMDALEPSKHQPFRREGMPVNGSSVEDALEQAFALLNYDNRANGQVERSLSVGDVLEVDGDFYAVAPMGFTRLCGVMFADAMENACRCMKPDHEGTGHRGIVLTEAVR